MKLKRSWAAAPALLALLGLVMLVSSPSHGGDTSRARQLHDADEYPELWWLPDRIQGVWNVRVNITVCATGATVASFDAMSLFGADGSFLDTNAHNPATRSEAFGSWSHVRGRTYRFAFRNFRFDPSGTPLGSQVIRHEVVLAKNGRHYESAGTAEFYDVAGNLTGTGCSTSTASRAF